MVSKSVWNACCICGSVTLTIVVSRIAINRPTATTAATRQRYAFVIFSDPSVGALRIPRKMSSTTGFRVSARDSSWSVKDSPRETTVIHPALPWQEYPKLVHQAQGIEVGPLFGDLATHE